MGPTTDLADTIFALASGAGRAAIAVVRVSGPQAHAALAALAGRLPPPRQAALARLRDPTSGETLDHALVLAFEASRSELGEDGAELHLHGSPAVVAAVLGVLAAQPGLRPAEPGEFTRRAFLNGKLDLAQVEGLADLIEAETEIQRRQAQRQISGALRQATAPWRAAMIEAAALVETAIDFAEDVELAAPLAQVRVLIEPVRAGLAAELAHGRAAERVRDGVQIVIAGPPNAGKSSLLNALARREAAIVSTIAGTTRDPIEVHLDLGGCPVTLVDTAGLRESGDEIERIGVSRARARADDADLVLWLSEDGTPPPPALALPVWRLDTKADLKPRRAADGDDSSVSRETLAISTASSLNLDRLAARLTDFVAQIASSAGAIVTARARHREGFAAAFRALERVAVDSRPIELVAEDLRVARFALDRLIGAVDVEDVLDEVFARFCIGK